MIRISVDFKDAKKFSQIIRYIQNNLVYPEAQEQVRILGHHVADNMRETINSSKKRPDKGTQRLENAITAETLETTGGVEVGIGKIQKLKEEAPYFEVLDGGGYVPPANVGFFGDNMRAPEAGGYGEDWKHTGKGSGFYFMKPMKAIEGIHYISKAIAYLDRELKNLIIKLGGTFIKGIEKAST